MVDSAVWLLINIAWKSAAILVVAIFVDFIFLRRRPLAADTLWTVVLLMLVVLPLLATTLPGAAITISIAASPPKNPSSATPNKDDHANAMLAVPLADAPPEEASSLSTVHASQNTSAHTSSSSFPRLNGITWPGALLSVYLTGFSFLAIRSVNSWRASQRLRRRASHVANPLWLERLNANCRRLSLRQPVEILQSIEVHVPFAMGWRRPCIVVPTSMIDDSTETAIDSTLLHELAHLSRRDYPILLGSHAIRCFYWFNPLIWFAVRRLNELREIVCDGYSVSLMADRGGYASVLITLAQSMPERSPAVLGLAMARTKRLERRLLAISFYSIRRSVASPRVRAIAAALAAMVAITTSLTSIQAETSSPIGVAEKLNDELESVKDDTSPEPLPFNDAKNVDLANKLLKAQEVVAEYIRRDLIEEGVADEVRPKAEAARIAYEKLRSEVLARRNPMMASEDVSTANHELYFDGVTSFVELPTVKYTGQMPYTIEAIVSPEPVPGFKVNPELHSFAHYMAIVTDTEYGGIELGLYPNALSFEARSIYSGMYETACHPCLPFVTRRMHVAAVIEDGEIRLYANGKRVSSSPFTGPVKQSPFTMRIGCSPHPVTECHDMYRGKIDEVRLSEAALYAQDYKASDRLTADDATVALYHFDEGGGLTVKDSSGNGNDGIIHDARWSRVGQ